MKKSKILSLLALGILTFTSCEKESLSDSDPQEVLELNTNIQLEDENANYISGKFYGTDVLYEQLENGNLGYGDIILTPEQVALSNANPTGKGVIGRIAKTWQKQGEFYIVPYTIAPFLTRNFRVIDAIKHWQNNTKIRFVLRTNQNDYVNFTMENGCFSALGRIGGKQDLGISDRCTTGTVIHEIGHAIGLHHEHQHPARDNFITVNTQNIIPFFESQFNKLPWSQVWTRPFDIESIMMYGSFNSSQDGRVPTITRKNGMTYRNNSTVLSNGDKATVAIVYK